MPISLLNHMSSDSLKQQHFSTKIFAGFLYLLKRDFPHLNVDTICSNAGLPLSFIENENNWVSAQFAKAFTELCIEATGLNDLPQRAGKVSVTEKLLGRTVFRLVRYVLPLRNVYRKIQELTYLYNKLTTVEMVEDRPGYLKLRYKLSEAASTIPRSVRDPTLEFSFANILGYYEAIPTIQGLPPASVSFDREQDSFIVQIRYTIQKPWAALLPTGIAAIGFVILFIFGHETAALVTLLLGAFISLLVRDQQLARGTTLTLEALNQTDQRYLELFRSHERQQELVDSYARFVPWELLQLLNKQSILDVRVGDFVDQPMSVVFTDIRDFTRLSERLTPEESFRFLNSYLEKISPAVRTHGGFIDNFLADGILAIFPESPKDAVEAALDITQRLHLYNEGRVEAGYEALRVGVGIHFGPLALGTIGNPDQMRGTVISDTANTASRLEALTKVIRVETILSASVYDLLPINQKELCRPLGWARLKGKSEVVKIFELMTPSASAIFLPHQILYQELLDTLASEHQLIETKRRKIAEMKKLLPQDRFLDFLEEQLSLEKSEGGFDQQNPLSLNPFRKSKAA